MSDYKSFLAKKAAISVPTGLETVPKLGAGLFPFQADLVSWALRRGRAAIFADCGLGKTLMELEWARHVAAHTSKRVLILTPLAVAGQMVREAERFGIGAVYLREPTETSERIVVTNYERVEKFDVSEFGGIACDESSILKSFTSVTRSLLIELFAATPYRLAATATPAPNDHMELGNHSEFLGIKTRAEMLSEYFVHDSSSTQDWRLKGHAEGVFWDWVASWASAVRRPSDIGHEDIGYDLPPLKIHEHVVASDQASTFAAGMLFAMPARGLDEQRKARRATLERRVDEVVAIVEREPDESWLIWVELNDEGDMLAERLPDAVQVTGSDTPEFKEKALLDFAEGRIKRLISKPSLAGFGMNFQVCARIAFVGVTHSFEQFFQAVRRCHRFGQRRPVQVHVVSSELESEVLASLRAKERDVGAMLSAMVEAMRDRQLANIRGATKESNPYIVGKIDLPHWARRAS